MEMREMTKKSLRVQDLRPTNTHKLERAKDWGMLGYHGSRGRDDVQETLYNISHVPEGIRDLNRNPSSRHQKF